MDVIINNPKKSVNVGPEKLYTQQEVDDLLEEKKDNPPSLSEEIRGETQAADKQKRLDNRTVDNLVKKSNRLMISISSIFPFDIFPDTINVEEGRITIIRRNFFISSQVHSVDIKDISNIFVNIAPFFAQLVIISKTFEENEIKIKYLRKKEAILVRRIIEGLRIFISKQIDTSGYTKDELIDKLKELSTTEIVT